MGKNKSYYCECGYFVFKGRQCRKCGPVAERAQDKMAPPPPQAPPPQGPSAIGGQSDWHVKGGRRGSRGKAAGAAEAEGAGKASGGHKGQGPHKGKDEGKGKTNGHGNSKGNGKKAGDDKGGKASCKGHPGYALTPPPRAPLSPDAPPSGEPTYPSSLFSHPSPGLTTFSPPFRPASPPGAAAAALPRASTPTPTSPDGAAAAAGPPQRPPNAAAPGKAVEGPYALVGQVLAGASNLNAVAAELGDLISTGQLTPDELDQIQWKMALSDHLTMEAADICAAARRRQPGAAAAAGSPSGQPGAGGGPAPGGSSGDSAPGGGGPPESPGGGGAGGGGSSGGGGGPPYGGGGGGRPYQWAQVFAERVALAVLDPSVLPTGAVPLFDLRVWGAEVHTAGTRTLAEHLTAFRSCGKHPANTCPLAPSCAAASHAGVLHGMPYQSGLRQTGDFEQDCVMANGAILHVMNRSESQKKWAEADLCGDFSEGGYPLDFEYDRGGNAAGFELRINSVADRGLELSGNSVARVKAGSPAARAGTNDDVPLRFLDPAESGLCQNVALTAAADLQMSIRASQLEHLLREVKPASITLHRAPFADKDLLWCKIDEAALKQRDKALVRALQEKAQVDGWFVRQERPTHKNFPPGDEGERWGCSPFPADWPGYYMEDGNGHPVKWDPAIHAEPVGEEFYAREFCKTYCYVHARGSEKGPSGPSGDKWMGLTGLCAAVYAYETREWTDACAGGDEDKAFKGKGFNNANRKADDMVPDSVALRQAYKKGKEAVCIGITQQVWQRELGSGDEAHKRTFKSIAVPVECVSDEGDERTAARSATPPECRG